MPCYNFIACEKEAFFIEKLERSAERRVSPERYFEAMEQRIARISPGGPYVFFIRAAGRVIELRFASFEMMTAARDQLRCCETASVKAPDARFFYWNDDIEPYLPEGGAGNHYLQIFDRASGAHLRIWPNGILIASNPLTRSYYFCEQAKSREEFFHSGHALVHLFSLWARESGLLLLHGAVVGEEGQGVLICARGGSGKSTLAIACLLAGLDFVSDDYALVSGSGPFTAWPLYSMICLNPDMYGKLPELRAPVLSVNRERGERLLLDASGYRFCPSLSIRAVLFPEITEDAEPSFHPMAPGRAMVHLIDSTIHQVGEAHNTGFVQSIAGRLLNTQVFRVSLCGDPMKNARAVGRFIREDLQHVQGQ